MQTLNLTLGSKIRRLREDHNLSREQMAEYLGICKRTYDKIETDERLPTIPELEIIAKLLKVSTDDLLHKQPVIVFLGGNADNT